MSKFLGPIHYLMYDKIKFQDNITEYLIGNSDNFTKLNKKLPPVSTLPLDNIVDQTNIHGWLASKIDIVESRLSYALLISDNVEEKMYHLGKKIAFKETISSIDEVFTVLNKYLLDGMPCDRALSANMDNEENLYLIQNINVHEKYSSNPLDIDSSLSLSETCEGSHDHDHHESFEVHHASFTPEFDNNNICDLYHKSRFQFIKGLIENFGFSVTMVNSNDYKISKI